MQSGSAEKTLTPERPLSSGGGTWHRMLFAVLLLTGAVVAVYGRICSHQFINWDDHFFINRPEFRPPTWAGLVHVWTAARAEIYVPVTSTVWWLLAHLAYAPGRNLTASVYHTASVAVHCASCLLAFAVLRRIVGGVWAPVAGAAVFALHPMQVEAVAWASDLKDLLAGCFALAGIWLYLRMVQLPEPQRRRSWIAAWVLTAIAFQLAALSKPSGALAPAVAAAVDYFFVGRPLRQVLKLTGPLLLLTIPWLIVARLVQPEPATITLSWVARCYVPGDTLYFYLGKLLLPVNLIPDYARDPKLVAAAGYCYWTWIIPLLLAVVLVVARKKCPWLLAATVVAVIPILPMLGFVAFDFQIFTTAADHYVYLAMLGPAIACTYFLSRVAPSGWRWVALAVIACLGGLSYVQAGYWRDDATLWLRAIEVNPQSTAALKGAASVMMQMGPEHADTSAELLARAVERRPDDPNAVLFVARQWLGQQVGQEQAMRVLARLNRMVDQLPPDVLRANVKASIGDLLLQRGDAAKAAEYYRRALSDDPAHKVARAGLQAAGVRLATQPTTLP